MPSSSPSAGGGATARVSCRWVRARQAGREGGRDASHRLAAGGRHIDLQQAEIGGRVASHRLAASRDCKTAKRIESRPQRPRALMCRESSSCTCFWNSRSFAISSTIVSLDSRSRTSCAQRSDQRWLLSCSSFTVATRVASSTPLTDDAIGLRSRRRSRSWRVSLCAGMGWRAPPMRRAARHCLQFLAMRSCLQSPVPHCLHLLCHRPWAQTLAQLHRLQLRRAAPPCSHFDNMRARESWTGGICRRGIREIPAHDGPPRRWRPTKAAGQPKPPNQSRRSESSEKSSYLGSWVRGLRGLARGQDES